MRLRYVVDKEYEGSGDEGICHLPNQGQEMQPSCKEFQEEANNDHFCAEPN
jgi:hypothetical protein